MSGSRWRAEFRPVIARVLAENAGQPDAVIRKALRSAWQRGPRKNHPYKMWLKEIAVQRGLKTEGRPGRRKHEPSPTGQLSLAPLLSPTVCVLAKADEDDDKFDGYAPYWMR